MASRSSSSGHKFNKPELVAIYRLEFYKNKKKWKFSNEKKTEPPQPACLEPKTEPKSEDSWNATYEVNSSSDKDVSPLNKAFMHESSDDIDEILARPSTPPPNEDVRPDEAAPPGLKACPADIRTSTRASTDPQPKLTETQAVQSPNRPQTTSTQQSRVTTCKDKHKPDDNRLWLPKPSDQRLAKRELSNNQKSDQQPWPQSTNICPGEPTLQSTKHQHKMDEQLWPPATNIPAHEPTPEFRNNQQNVDQELWRSTNNIWGNVDVPNNQHKIDQKQCRSTINIWNEPTPDSPNNQHILDQEPCRPTPKIWANKPPSAPPNNQQNIEQQVWPPTTNIWTNKPTPDSEKFNFPMQFTHPPPPIINNAHLIPQNVSPKEMSPTAPVPINPIPPIPNSKWSVPPPSLPDPLQQKEMLASLLKRQTETELYDKIEKGLQPSPANCLQMLLCPDKWKKQSIPDAGNFEDQYLNPPITDAAKIWPSPQSKPEPEFLKQRESYDQRQMYPNPSIIKRQAPSTPPFSKSLIPASRNNKESIPYPILNNGNNNHSIPMSDNRNHKRNDNNEQSTTFPIQGNGNNSQSIPISLPGNNNNEKSTPFSLPANSNNETRNPFPILGIGNNKQSIPFTNSWNNRQAVPAPDIWTNELITPAPHAWINKVTSPPPGNWDYRQSIPVPGTLANSQQKNSQFTFRESFANRPQNLEQPIYGDTCQTKGPNIRAPPPSPEVFPAHIWCDPQKVQNVWTNPGLSQTAETLQRNVMEKQEDACQDRDQDWDHPAAGGEDALDGDGGILYSAANQDTLKSCGDVLEGEGQGEGEEVMSPAQVRQNAYEWVRRLAALYRDPDETDYDYQGEWNESANFIREAHDVPHSSEMDPDETRECVCAPLPAALSPRRLAAALRGGAEALRVALREQLLRDRLKSQPAESTLEYPTRDSNPFGGEFVVGGSHITHPTAQLAATHRVIKIDMGRPYRLRE